MCSGHTCFFTFKSCLFLHRKTPSTHLASAGSLIHYNRKWKMTRCEIDNKILLLYGLRAPKWEALVLPTEACSFYTVLVACNHSPWCNPIPLESGGEHVSVSCLISSLQGGCMLIGWERNTGLNEWMNESGQVASVFLHICKMYGITLQGSRFHTAGIVCGDIWS